MEKDTVILNLNLHASPLIPESTPKPIPMTKELGAMSYRGQLRRGQRASA